MGGGLPSGVKPSSTTVTVYAPESVIAFDRNQ
jgi:hypothetical protein